MDNNVRKKHGNVRTDCQEIIGKGNGTQKLSGRKTIWIPTKARVERKFGETDPVVELIKLQIMKSQDKYKRDKDKERKRWSKGKEKESECWSM